MFKTTAIDTLKQDKKCQACWYMILSTMSGSTTVKQKEGTLDISDDNTLDRQNQGISDSVKEFFSAMQ
jgi:mannose-6-phosphate isomerase class I